MAGFGLYHHSFDDEAQRSFWSSSQACACLADSDSSSISPIDAAPDQLEGQHVTKFGRTALFLIASIAVLLLAIDAAAAKTRKHKPIAASPTPASKSTTHDS